MNLKWVATDCYVVSGISPSAAFGKLEVPQCVGMKLSINAVLANFERPLLPNYMWLH